MRHRYDSERPRRIKTVELIEQEQPWFASGAVYLVKIGWDETALRAGETEDGRRPLALGSEALETTGTVTRPLGLEERVVTRLKHK